MGEIRPKKCEGRELTKDQLVRNRIGRVAELRQQRVGVGGVAVLEHDGAQIYYLVTKPRYSDKPTLATLRQSLLAMRAHATASGVRRLDMPRIGCGLDGLRWSESKNGDEAAGGVRELVAEVFQGSGIEVTVFSL